MYIRYQHVRNIAIGAGVLGVLSCCGWCIASPSTPDTSARPSVTHVATRTPQTSSTNAPTSDDGRIIQLISRSASPNGKLKDALGASSPIKVNVYEDDGDTRWDRVKLDRDRDGRGEETWIRKNDTWTRNDGAEVWDGQRWAAPGAARRRTGKATDGKTDLVDVAQLMLTQRATSDKIKDLKAGNGPKINLYDEDKNGTWDRAKVDLDRDDNWDEKWTVKNGTVERTIEKSGKTFVLDGDRWVDPNAAPAHTPTPKATGKTDLVDVAQLMLTQRATSDKIKDLKAGNGPKINLYDDDKNGTWDRAKVDRDRDDTWDEKWTVKGGTVERAVDKTGVVYVLDGERWVEKR